MIMVVPTMPFLLKPAVAEAFRPVCYLIFYWTGIIISPEALVAGAMLWSVLLLLLASLVRRFLDGASSDRV